MNRQKGMSLIELMVAMGLGLFLILGVVNVFIANKDSTQVETSLARLQEMNRSGELQPTAPTNPIVHTSGIQRVTGSSSRQTFLMRRLW